MYVRIIIIGNCSNSICRHRNLQNGKSCFVSVIRLASYSEAFTVSEVTPIQNKNRRDIFRHVYSAGNRNVRSGQLASSLASVTLSSNDKLTTSNLT